MITELGCKDVSKFKKRGANFDCIMNHNASMWRGCDENIVLRSKTNTLMHLPACEVWALSASSNHELQTSAGKENATYVQASKQASERASEQHTQHGKKANRYK